jgi:hypothetical protein
MATTAKKRKRRKHRGSRLDRAGGGTYRLRHQALLKLGYATYAEYLRGPEWATIRAKVLIDGAKCYVCDRPATQVHHGSYRPMDLSGKCLDKLYPICGGCHRRIEYRRADGEKLQPKQATSKMKQLATQRRKELAAEDYCWDVPAFHRGPMAPNGRAW